MSQSHGATPASGPALSDTVYELQGWFPSDSTMQDAISRLTLLGFDRADFSMVPTDVERNTPEEAVSPDTPIDSTQLRTMNSGMTGAAVGTAVAAVLASGGLAAPVVIAGAGLTALGATAATSGAGLLVDKASSAERDRLGADGRLALAVRINRPDQVEPAIAAMRDAGAHDVRNVTRVDDAQTRGVSSAGWTG